MKGERTGGAANSTPGVQIKFRFNDKWTRETLKSDAPTIRTYHGIQLEKNTKTPRVT